MNRRGFFGCLACLPFVGGLFTEPRPEKIKMFMGEVAIHTSDGYWCVFDEHSGAHVMATDPWRLRPDNGNRVVCVPWDDECTVWCLWQCEGKEETKHVRSNGSNGLSFTGTACS